MVITGPAVQQPDQELVEAVKASLHRLLTFVAFTTPATGILQGATVRPVPLGPMVVEAPFDRLEAAPHNLIVALRLACGTLDRATIEQVGSSG